MDLKDALMHLAGQAVRAAGPHEPVAVKNVTIPQLILAEHEKLVDIEKLQDGRARYRGTLSTTSLADFVDYTQRRSSDSTRNFPVFIDPAKMQAKAFFNLGSNCFPGHGDDTAVLSLTKTGPFEALCAFKGQRVSQKELAEFVEDWRAHITAFNGVDADGALQVVPLVKAIAGIRQVSIEALAKSDNAVGDLSETRTTLESVEAKSANVIPTALGFTCTPYDSLTEVNLLLRVSLITGEKPLFTLRIVRETEEVEKIAQSFKDRLFADLKDDAALTVGVFVP